MRLLLPFVFVCLFVCAASGQSLRAVSVYQLGFKPDHRAKKFVERGCHLIEERKFSKSLEDFQAAVELEPDYWQAQNDLGYVYLQLAEPTQAADAFQRAINIDPLNPIAYANLGVTAFNDHHYRLAEKLARRALDIEPDFATAKALLGLAEVAQGKWGSEAWQNLQDTRQVIPSSKKILTSWTDIDHPPSIMIDGSFFHSEPGR